MVQVKNVKHTGNISMQDVIGIARIMRPRSMSREMSGTVREILGTCQSVGCTVDGESPHDLIDKARPLKSPMPASPTGRATLLCLCHKIIINFCFVF